MAPMTDSTDLEFTDPALKPLIVESVLSEDGKCFFIYKLALDGGQQQHRVVCEKWDLMCPAPKLAECTTRLLSTGDWEAQWRESEGSHGPKLHLVPSKWTQAPPDLYDFIHSVQLPDRVQLSSEPGANMRDDWGRLLGENWGCASRRNNFLILCRRKRIHSSSDDKSISERRRREVAGQRREMRRSRPAQTYDEELDFDKIPESEGSSQDNDFDLATESEVPDDKMSSSNPGSLGLRSSISDQVSEIMDARSLSEIGSAHSGSSNNWETSLSIGGSISSSSSSTSTVSEKRLRTYEILNSSGNRRHYHELLLQHQCKSCDICDRDVLRWLHCFECLDSDFDICLSCVGKGRWCSDRSHELLEADGDGPITMRRCSEWVITNEIRVYDLHDKGTQNCVLEFSAAREHLLHESQPAVHPSAPIFAWPLSPTKLLLAAFEGDKERIVQRMTSFMKNGRKVDVQVRFSDSGSCLFVASIEAVRVRGKMQEETYNLHMQVAVLQLLFEDQALTHPMTLCEQHYDLLINMPSTLETLPFVWTWTCNEVCLTVTRDQISLYRVKFNPSGDGRFHLGPVETSAAQLPLRYHHILSKAQLIHVREGDVPFVALTPLRARNWSEFPSMCYIKADGPWSACDEKGVTSHTDAEVQTALFMGPRDYEAHTMTYTNSSHASFSKMPQQLSEIRSEIRLLCLLPGSTDDALCCTLSKVSLASLETSKSKWEEFYSEFDRRAEEKYWKSRASTSEKEASPRGDTELVSADFEPRVFADVDYSKTQNADVTVFDMMCKAGSQSNTLRDNLSSISLHGLTGSTAALLNAIMEERNQDQARTWKNLLHPKYNYEALSYVWGQSSGNRTITVDGKKGVPVTDNLHAALRRLRRPDCQRVLWVDALCINQNNIEERNWQVQMMGRIYSTAARVVIWLGDAEDHDPNVDHPPIDGGGELSQEVDEDLDEDVTSSSGSTKSKKVSQWQRDALLHVLKTASPQWWTRAWVTQELVLAKDINVAFGEAEVGWSTFKSAMWGIWSSISELRQLMELRRGRRTWQYKGSIGETALLARHTEATDARDKVYSLLSLVKPAQKSCIKPNYGLDPMEVFIQATYVDMWDNIFGNDIYKEAAAGFGEGTRHGDVPSYPVMSDSDQLVQTGRRPDRFRILNWAKPNAPKRKELPGMPSWALDFSDPAVLTGDAEFRFGSERWTFDGNNNLNQRALLNLSENNRQLTVRGAVLGRIKDIIKEYPVREYRSRPADDATARLLILLSGLPSESPYKLVSGPNARLRTDDLRVIRKANFLVKETKPGALVVEYKEQVDQILQHWDPLSGHDAIDWTDLHSLVLNRGNCDVEGCRCAPSQFFRSWDSCVGVDDCARNFSWPDKNMRRTSPWERYCELLEGNKQNHVRPRDPLRDEESRFLMTTSSGFIGLGPEIAEAGDVISLFYGSDIPVVLRPVGDHYVYRGRAWINGIMQGELWNIYEDPLLEEQDFEIL